MPDDALIRFPTACPQCGQPAEYLCRPDDRHGVTCCERCGARTPEVDEPAPTA